MIEEIQPAGVVSVEAYDDPPGAELLPEEEAAPASWAALRTATGTGRARSVAAQRLGITEPGTPVWINDRWFTVTGIIGATPLDPDIERSALVGWQVAQADLGFDGHPTTIYERSAPDQVENVAAVLAQTIYPSIPTRCRSAAPRSWNAAARSAYAARWAPPVATSAPSSSPSRCYSPPWAASRERS